MNTQQLSVRLYGKPIGVLEQTQTGKKRFAYEALATHAISMSMPLREEPYSDEFCEAFFGGLLPESQTVRKILGKRYGINGENTFALLRAIGHDCAGAISLHNVDAPIQEQDFFVISGKEISSKELYQHLKELPTQPLFAGFGDLRLSLAGMHNKGAICVIEGKFILPEGGCPTTHILKPAIPEFENIIENEFFCLSLAKHIGLPIPNIQIKHFNDIKCLMIERYDRTISNNQIKRIHQEDFCQALSITSVNKYQNDGGPSFTDCFTLLNESSQPAIDRNILIKAVIFNYLIGNMDAHGKNFSLLHKANNQIQLAPFYDMVCTLIYYPRITKKMAMKIGNSYESDLIFPRHWEKLCKDIQFSYPAFKKLYLETGEALLKALVSESTMYSEIIPFLKKRITETLELFV